MSLHSEPLPMLRWPTICKYIHDIRLILRVTLQQALDTIKPYLGLYMLYVGSMATSAYMMLKKDCAFTDRCLIRSVYGVHDIDCLILSATVQSHLPSHNGQLTKERHQHNLTLQSIHYTLVE